MKKVNMVVIRLNVLGMFLLLLCLGPLSVGHAAQQGAIEYPIPAPFIPALQSDGTVRYITAREIESTIRLHSKEFKKLYWNNEIKRFIVPRHAWLDDLLDFMLIFLNALGYRARPMYGTVKTSVPC
jgi:hypothetical protein